MSFKNKKKQKFRNFGAFEKLDKLQEANFLIESENWSEALTFLDDATKKYPSEARFWELFAAAANALEDVLTMQLAFRKLTQLHPGNSDAWFGLAYAYTLDHWVALSYRGFRDFLRKFPGNERSADAAELMELAEKGLRRNLALFDFPEGEEGIELACWHEESQILMNQGDLEEAKEKALKVISRMPDFAPAYNNLSLILFMSGEAEKAEGTARKVIEKQPENFHALSNLVRFSIFLGKPDEARQFADRLRLVKNENPDLWIKKIEAFTFAGDDKTVVEVYKEAIKKSAALDSFAKHLAAYAFYQLGKQGQARKLWQEILSDDPNFELAVKNQYELNLAENERNVFALFLNYWIPAQYINDLRRETGKIKDGRHFEKNLQKKLSQFFAKNPNILYVLSILLERGDLIAKEFAINLMSWAATPESFAALKEFAFGQKGSDKIRYQAAMKLSEADAIPRKVRLWQNGEWQELMLLVFDVTEEPTDIYPMKPKAQQFLLKGLEALQKKNLDLAEQYYQMALEANGEDHPSLLYNLLTIRVQRGDEFDFDTELRELTRKFPEHSFSAISLAISEIRAGNLEAAKNLTERFYEKERWHISEMKIWFYYTLEMALAEKQFNSARMSLEMLQRFDENLDYKYWDTLISTEELLNTFSDIPSKLEGRMRKKKKL